MTNEQKFKTPEERYDAFTKMCSSKPHCGCCKYNGAPSKCKCLLLWLADEYKELDLPFKVQPMFGGGSIIVETAKDSKVIGEMQGLVAQQVCASINAAALAWHKRMVEKGE